MMRVVERSVEALKMLQELDSELAVMSERSGRSLVWTAADRKLLEMVADAIDRIVDLTVLYDATPDISPRVKLSAEIRLLEGHLARLLRQLHTDLPEPRQREPSHVVSARASRAAKARWYPNATG